MSARQSASKTSRKAVFFHKHWWKIGLIVLLVSSLSFLGYNKYLDRQNVNNMKQLLADFEQLKTDVEAETGEKLVIEATCGSVGKFATTYSCRIVLPTTVNNALDENYVNSITKHNISVLNLSSCEFLTGGKDNYKNSFRCDIEVRNINSAEAEKIFYDYDTSPGSSI